MYCLTNICYVCLEKKENSLININSSLSVNKDIMHIICDLPFNLGWMKTKQIILICEECCGRLRETYHLLAMCLRNSAVMQGYMDRIITASLSTADKEAELRVVLNNKQDDVSEIKCEIKLEQEEIYTIGPIIEENDEVFVNVDDHFVKVEDNWDTEELPMKNNSTESSANESDWEMAVNSNNTHDTDTDSDSSAFTPTQVHTTKKKKRNTPANGSFKCPTCNKSFTWKAQLQSHKRVHRRGTQYKCATCTKCCRDNYDLLRHERTHTGEKPYKCSRCNKSFRHKSSPMRHIVKCVVCCEEFCTKLQLKSHWRVHIEH